MDIKLCIEEGCETAQFSRKLCNKHYQSHKYRGTLSQVSPSTTHRLSNLDKGTRIGDCSLCGAGVPIRPHGKQWKCQFKSKQNRRMVLTYAEGEKIPRNTLNAAFEKLNASQQGLCASCGKTNPDRSSLSLDHCHSTGKIRGLLCRNCNSGIGLLGDNVEGLQAALAYLTKAEE